jgi:type II secretory pathway pseudopilin PulG
MDTPIQGRESVQPMKPRQRELYKARKGFTLLELAVIFMIVGLLATFAVISFGGTDEQRDASMVQSAQASLQTIVTQGSTRLDVTPKELRNTKSDAIRFAMQDMLGQSGSQSAGVEFETQGSDFVLTIKGSNRKAYFTITDTGDVELRDVSNFTLYKAQDGIIKKI